MGLAIVAGLGLTGCGNNREAKSGEAPASQEVTPSAAVEEEIVVTAANNKVDLLIGEQVQLTSSVTGVEWKSRATSVATVDANGLVTAVGVGQVKIRAEKDGYKTGSITINVSKPAEQQAKYTIGLEDADHYSPNDFWGIDLSQWGMTGIMGPGDSPVEDNGGKTPDGTSLGYLSQGCKETLTFTCDKAANVGIGVTMAYNAEMDLSTVLSVKFNNKPIDMTGRTVEGPEDGDTNNYYDFHTVDFGKVDLVAGNNVLVIEMLAQAPNMDEFKIFTDATLAIAVVKPAAKPQIEVTPASVELYVGDTQQLTCATAGVSYTSSAEAVATVSSTGLITAVKAGDATITVAKDGMKKATVAVKVTNRPVSGQTILEMEDGTLSDGIQVENDGNASGGKSIGYFSDGLKVTVKYQAEAARKVKLTLVASSSSISWDNFPTIVVADQSLETSLTMTANAQPVSLAGKVLQGTDSASFSDFRVWREIDLGEINLKAGENEFVFTAVGQGPNLDCLKLTNV